MQTTTAWWAPRHRKVHYYSEGKVFLDLLLHAFVHFL
jgi:hypothetical protein